MSGFTYFLSDVNKMPSDEKFKELGLDEFCGLQCGNVGSTGPTGKGGVCFGIAGRTPDDFKLGYYPKEQVWTEFLDGKFWVGYYSNNPPLEKYLKRDDGLPGHMVKLGDGNEWEVPIARKFEEGCVLPETIYIASDGTYKNKSVEKYLNLAQCAENVWNDFSLYMEGEPSNDYVIDSDEKRFDVAFKCLSTNYKIGRYEISALSLINSTNTHEINFALIDILFLMEANKALSEIDDLDSFEKKIQQIRELSDT